MVLPAFNSHERDPNDFTFAVKDGTAAAARRNRCGHLNSFLRVLFTDTTDDAIRERSLRSTRIARNINRFANFNCIAVTEVKRVDSKGRYLQECEVVFFVGCKYAFDGVFRVFASLFCAAPCHSLNYVEVGSYPVLSHEEAAASCEGSAIPILHLQMYCRRNGFFGNLLCGLCNYRSY